MDEERFSEFMRVESRVLLATIVLVCGDARIGEEALQEALFRAWQRLNAGEQIDSLGAWVRTVALNLIRDHFRRFGRERRAIVRLADRSVVEAPDDIAVHRVDLLRALAKLSRRQREVAVLHYQADFSVTEIAVALQMAEGTVKVQLHRARRSLSQQLSETSVPMTPVLRSFGGKS